MVELLSQLMEMIKGMPDLAVWVLAGVLLYKVVVIGSWIGVLRLLINKVYTGVTKDKVINHDVSGRLMGESAYKSFERLMDELAHDGSRWLSNTDIEYARKALNDRREFEKTDEFKQGRKSEKVTTSIYN